MTVTLLMFVRRLPTNPTYHSLTQRKLMGKEMDEMEQFIFNHVDGMFIEGIML